jgi:hypothetical protein
MNSEPDDPQWEKTRSLLREHLAAPALPHPDFLNNRVLEAIEREDFASSRGSKPVALRWLVWPGLAAVAMAVLLTAVFLPREFGFPSEQAFISHVVEARSENPRLSVTSFPVPNELGVVIWIEGESFIPAEEPVQ